MMIKWVSLHCHSQDASLCGIYKCSYGSCGVVVKCNIPTGIEKNPPGDQKTSVQNVAVTEQVSFQRVQFTIRVKEAF